MSVKRRDRTDGRVFRPAGLRGFRLICSLHSIPFDPNFKRIGAGRETWGRLTTFISCAADAIFVDAWHIVTQLITYLLMLMHSPDGSTIATS